MSTLGREDAALDTGRTPVRYISLNGFVPDMLAWEHSPRLEISFLSWADLRDQVLAGVSGHASALLDEFDLTSTSATARQSGSELCAGHGQAPVRAVP